MDSRDNFVQCNVCSAEFDDNSRIPRILPCLHTFCTSCLQEMTSKLEVECPDCNARHGRPQNGITDYPVDIACRNFLDFVRVQQRPSEVPCTDCPDGDTAQTFCKDCSTFMCKECTSAHKRTQITRKHSVVPLSELKESELEFHRKETCTVRGHEDQIFTFYCDKRGCDKPVCTLCAVSEHNQTNGHVLRNLTDVYEDGKAVIQNVIAELNDKGSPIPEAMEKYQNVMKDKSLKENEVNQEIDRTFDKLIEILQDRRGQLHKEVEAHSQSRFKILQDRLNELKSFTGDVLHATNFTSRVISYTNPTEFLQLKNQILKRLVELKSLSVSIPEKSEIGIKFNVGISEESFAQLVRGIGNISQAVNARKDFQLPLNDRDTTTQRQTFPVTNGVRESYESPKRESSENSRRESFDSSKSDSSSAIRQQSQQKVSSPITNGPTSPAKYAEDRSILSPRMMRLNASPKTDARFDFSPKSEEKPIVAPKTNTSVSSPKPESTLPERRLRPAPSSLTKSDNKAAPMGLGDFLKELENRGQLPNKLGESTFKPLADRTFQPVSPDRSSHNIASPVTPTAKFDPSKTLGPRSPRTPDTKDPPMSPNTLNSSGTFGEIICPDISYNVLTTHLEREVTMDGKVLRNRKSGAPSGSSTAGNSDGRLQQYKGVIGTFPFKDPGKYYYEIVVTFTIEEPLEETWLIFEMGLCRVDDIDKHHTVERHEHARSFYVARYPEDGKLAQEFWHNRDLRSFVPLCENVSGLTVEVTYGLLVDVKRKKWTIADVKKQKKLYTFMGVDFSEPLWPVFGSYNQDLVNVEMRIKSGSEITAFPPFLKGF